MIEERTQQRNFPWIDNDYDFIKIIKNEMVSVSIKKLKYNKYLLSNIIKIIILENDQLKKDPTYTGNYLNRPLIKKKKRTKHTNRSK